jgi:hypothetical protein
MAVYLGNFGLVSLNRKTFEEPQFFSVSPAEVNVTQRRFTLSYPDGADVTSTLVTGDRITISRSPITAGNLDFIAASGWAEGVKLPTGAWYIHVDELGSIRLFDTLAKALAGVKTDAIELEVPGSDIPVKITLENNPGRILCNVSSYELSTSRESVDVTSLSDSFRSQHSALISGSGRLSAVWDFKRAVGDTEEVPHYLLQLVLRTEIGSEFEARLFLKTENSGYGPGFADSLYYAFSAVVTNAGIAIASGTIVEMTIDFVTTGAIRLLLPTPTDEVLTEGGFKLLAEDDLTLDMELPID